MSNTELDHSDAVVRDMLAKRHMLDADGRPKPLSLIFWRHDDLWITKDQRVLRLEDMEPSHRANVMRMLWRPGLALRAWWIESLVWPMSEAEQAGYELEHLLNLHLAMDPVEWMRTTPLYCRLRDLNGSETDGAPVSPPHVTEPGAIGNPVTAGWFQA